jgi:adenosine deaminase
MRFAPQLHVRGDFRVRDVLRAVCRGLERAKKEINADPEVKVGPCRASRPASSSARCASSCRCSASTTAPTSRRCRAAPAEEIYGLASLELARAAVAAAEEDGSAGGGLRPRRPGARLPRQGPPEAAYQLAHEHFLGKTVHAGEDYGPESIFQAITDCHADRIGHGTWLFSKKHIKDGRSPTSRRSSTSCARYVAERRITLEVCLTSNQQTIPELRDDLSRHPFKKMRAARCSVTLCTDNRLVSRTTMTDEVEKAVTAFGLEPRALKDVLIYGFKRSFFPGPYPEKRDWVRSVLNYMEDLRAIRPRRAGRPPAVVSQGAFAEAPRRATPERRGSLHAGWPSR